MKKHLIKSYSLIPALEEESIKYETCFKLIIASGMRQGEYCGFQRKDIDFSTSPIHICRNAVKVTRADLFAKEPKTASSNRTVYFSLEMAILLIASGAGMVTVAAPLGHSQISTALDIYTHAFDSRKKETSAALQKSLEI